MATLASQIPTSGLLQDFLTFARQRQATTGRPASTQELTAILKAELSAGSAAAQRQATINTQQALQRRQLRNQRDAATVSGITQLGGTAATLGIAGKYLGLLGSTPAAGTVSGLGAAGIPLASAAAAPTTAALGTTPIVTSSLTGSLGTGVGLAPVTAPVVPGAAAAGGATAGGATAAGGAASTTAPAKPETNPQR